MLAECVSSAGLMKLMLVELVAESEFGQAAFRAQLKVMCLALS